MNSTPNSDQMASFAATLFQQWQQSQGSQTPSLGQMTQGKGQGGKGPPQVQQQTMTGPPQYAPGPKVLKALKPLADPTLPAEQWPFCQEAYDAVINTLCADDPEKGKACKSAATHAEFIEKIGTCVTQDALRKILATNEVKTQARNKTGLIEDLLKHITEE